MAEAFERTALVTGANRGLGLAHVSAFLGKGYRVWAACRAPAEAHDLVALADRHAGQLTLLPYDAEDWSAPDGLAAALSGASLDILFCNAGVMSLGAQSAAGVDPDAFMRTMSVNALAPLRLSLALAPNVAASRRKLIALQSTKMGSIADASGGMYAYRASKAALNMIAKALSNDLAPRGVSVIALHPGWVRTRMGGEGAPLSVSDSVARQQAILERAGPRESGAFLDPDGQPIPW